VTVIVRNTQAAILTAQKQPLIVEEIELPSSLDVGQVLVEIHFSGICGSQLGEIDGVKGDDPYLPHLLGHEGSGVVLEVGPGVRTVSCGDHVVLHWRPGSGIQSLPPVYKWSGRPLNAGFVTTFNKHAVVSENRLTTIPKDYPMDLAALFGCAVTTGIGVVENKGGLRMGESIVVVGAGGVGLNVIQGARLLSASTIIAVDLVESRVQLAMQIGATHGITSRDDSWVAQVRDIVGPWGADLVVDNTGVPDVISRCLELTGQSGRVVLIGVPKKGLTTAIDTLPLHFGKILTGTHGGDGSPSEDIPRIMRLNSLGFFDLSALISFMCQLSEINEAIAKMRSGEITGRCLVTLA
jgi:S-(hydroxymethyl)glutathione dehydrogenase/alcohol dehydrogenase